MPFGSLIKCCQQPSETINEEELRKRALKGGMKPIRRDE